MTTYMVHILTGDKFRDLYIKARDEQDAVRKARKQATPYELRWAAFIV